MRIKGVREPYAELLKDAGVDTVKELKYRNPGRLAEAMAAAEDLGAAIDTVLREYAKSPLVDPDPESPARAKERAKQLAELEAMYPGNWRAPRRRRSKKKR